MFLSFLAIIACGTSIPGLARPAKSLGASRAKSGSLAKMAVFSGKRVYFTGFSGISSIINRGLLEDSRILSKPVDLVEKTR